MSLYAQLSSLKDRLNITAAAEEPLLTRYIEAASAMFDRYCGRVFERGSGVTYEFPANTVEISVPCYPIESVTSFEVREDATSDWDTEDVDYEIFANCMIHLVGGPLGDSNMKARVTYTGGYVLPGTTPSTGQTALPKDVENACIEQAAFWYERRHSLRSTSPDAQAGPRRTQETLELLPHIRQALDPYRRLAL